MEKLKTIDEVKKGDICYVFTCKGEFKHMAKVTSVTTIEDVFGGQIYVKLKSCVKPRTYSTYSEKPHQIHIHGLEFPSYVAFFDKNGAAKYFKDKIAKLTSAVQNSLSELEKI